MSHARHVSSSSYTPVLINPSTTEPEPTLRSTRQSRQQLDLKYPYPLPLLACVDLAYIVYHALDRSPSKGIIILSAARAVVLIVVLGLSQRWRDRGGWIGALCGITVGYAVWTICKGQLERSHRSTHGKDTEPIHAISLGITAAMAVIEYIAFLLLLRLSPPQHRSNPLSLRLPRSAIQIPTEFAYDTEAESVMEDDPSSPLPQRRHLRQTSRHTLLHPESRLGTPSRPAHQMDDESDEDVDMEEDDLSSDTSSISESSIIDLPLPLSPARIVPPPSLSVNRGLDILAGIDSAPIVGAVVRRTRSARFLGRSWGSRSGDEEGGDYGTFGRAPAPPR